MRQAGKHHLTATPTTGLSRRVAVAGSIAVPALTWGASTASATTSGLFAKINAIDASTSGVLAVAVFDRRSGRSWQYNAPVRNECASIVKVLILAAVCHRAQTQGRALTTIERSQASAMIRVSDNASATSLWNSVGGASGVQAMAARLGMTSTVTARSWGLTTTTVGDQMLLLNELSSGGRVLAATHRSYVLGLMGQVASGQRWGVGAAGVAQLKNGWLSYAGQWRINSIGHVTGGGRDHTLAILQRTPTMGIGTSTANRVALAIYSHLATPL